MLDLFYPPKPPAIHNARRVLLMDAACELSPGEYKSSPRKSKFDGWTPEQFKEYRRAQQNARNHEKRKQQVREAGKRFRLRKAAKQMGVTNGIS